jgi:hypothetical protein
MRLASKDWRVVAAMNASLQLIFTNPDPYGIPMPLWRLIRSVYWRKFIITECSPLA